MRMELQRDADILAAFSLVPGEVQVLPIAVGEDDYVGLRLDGVPVGCKPFLRIGDQPQPDKLLPLVYALRRDSQESASCAVWAVHRYFELSAGRCVVTIEDKSTCAEYGSFALTVLPSRLTAGEYQRLMQDLQSRHRGLLLDVYGKTFVGTASTPPIPRQIPPLEFLHAAQRALGIFERNLAEIRRRPQQGYRVATSVHVSSGAARLRPAEISRVSAHARGLRETHRHDPVGVSINGRYMVVDRLTAPQTIEDLDIYEHRAMRWFLRRLRGQLGQLQRLAVAEYARRNADKAWKNVKRTAAEKSWWEIEDQPRLAPLQQYATLSETLCHRIKFLLHREPCLTKAGSFRPPLRPTATFTHRPPYQKVYALMRALTLVHGRLEFTGVDTEIRARNLPALFEYWCVFRVLEELARRFKALNVGPGQLFDTDRFIVDIRSGADVWFRSGDGRFVRFLYEPQYRTRGRAPSGYGRLFGGPDAMWTPDIAVEVSAKLNGRPEAIYIFDAKYSLEPDLTVAEKYLTGIGWHGDPAPLVRHSWLLAPADPDAHVETCDPWEVLTDPHIARKHQSIGVVPMNPISEQPRLGHILDMMFRADGILPFSARPAGK